MLVDRGCDPGVSGACPVGQFCKTPSGQCGASGACVAKPGGCADIYAPVCGCDGQTYASDCTAASQGANVYMSGKCPVIACKTAADCPASLGCVSGACQKCNKICTAIACPPGQAKDPCTCQCYLQNP